MLYALDNLPDKSKHVEVVDQENRLIAVMPFTTVQKQRLPYRTLIIVCKDQNHCGLLRYIPQDTLEIPYFAAQIPGQAIYSHAASYVKTCLNAQINRLVHLALVPPSQQIPSFITIVGLMITGPHLQRKVQEDNSYILIDDAACTGLLEQGFVPGPLFKMLKAQKIWQNFLLPKTTTTTNTNTIN